MALIAWNHLTGISIYDAGTTNDIYKFPAAVTAIWQNQNDIDGILYASGTNTGFIPIEGVTVNTTDIEQLRITNYELRIYPNPTDGVLYIVGAKYFSPVTKYFSPVTKYFSPTSIIEIFDMTGRCVSIVETGHALSLQDGTINITHFPAGIYFLKIDNQTFKITKK